MSHEVKLSKGLLANLASLLRASGKKQWSLFFLWMSSRVRCQELLLPSGYQPERKRNAQDDGMREKMKLGPR